MYEFVQLSSRQPVKQHQIPLQKSNLTWRSQPRSHKKNLQIIGASGCLVGVLAALLNLPDLLFCALLGEH